MRGPGRVWSDLSGGLDSSSIVSVAARLTGPSRLATVSVVFGESTWSDERSWSAAVARAHGVDEHYVDGDMCHPWSRLREAVDYWEEPHAAAAFFGVHRQYGRLLGGSGTPILLTGIGAEVVVMNKRQVPIHLADLLRWGRMESLARELDCWQRVLKIPMSNLVWRYCVKPLLSPPLISYDWMPQSHAWIERSFARRWDLSARARRAGMPKTQTKVANQWQVEMIGRITGFLLRGYLEKACDIRYPFLHRPLVELALKTPVEPEGRTRRTEGALASSDGRSVAGRGSTTDAECVNGPRCIHGSSEGVASSRGASCIINAGRPWHHQP